MALSDARLLATVAAACIVFTNLGVLPFDHDAAGAAASDFERRLHEEDASPNGTCAQITKARIDQLEWHQARACLGECYHHASAIRTPMKVLMWTVISAPFLLFIALVIIKKECPKRHELAPLVLIFGLLALCTVVWLDDFTGFFFHKNGTLCLKSLTCTAFGWTPAWLGLGLGFLLGAWSVWEAFRIPIKTEELLQYCGRRPRDDDRGQKTKLCGLFPVSLETAEAVKVHKKFSICFGDIILDTSGLLNYLRKGQPYYAIMTLLCILRAEAQRSTVNTDYTPHWHEVKPLRGWQADFIVYWRESRELGMVSSAFLFRATLEFQNETAWTSFIAISALLSSTCTAWFSLGQLLASMASGCLSVMDWAQDFEQSLAEDDVTHCFWQPETKEYEEVTWVRVIPRADHFARTQILGARSLGLVKAYRLCEFLSKAVVCTALLHFLSPVAFYLAGLLFAAALWHWQSKGHKKRPQMLICWFFPYLMLGNYPLTLPTCKSWLEPDSSSPAITAIFLGLCWVLLLEETVRTGWAQAVITHVEVVLRTLRDDALCESALLQNSTSEFHHWPEHYDGEHQCDFELTPSRVHRALKGGIILLGLAAELGLICTAIRLAVLRRKWHEEDEERLKKLERHREAVLYRELGGGEAEMLDEDKEFKRPHRHTRDERDLSDAEFLALDD